MHSLMEDEMEKYEDLLLEIIEFSREDIIVTSGEEEGPVVPGNSNCLLDNGSASG